MTIDRAEATELLRNIKEIEHTLRSINVTMTEAMVRLGGDLRNIGQQVDGITTKAQVDIKKMGDLGSEAIELMTSSMTDFGVISDHIFSKIKRNLDEFQHHPGMKAIFGDPDKAGAISGKMGGVGRLADRARGAVFANVSMGGMIGLLLAGQTQEASFKAAAATAVHEFESVTTTSGRHIDYLTSRVADLHAQFGSMGEEFEQVFGIMAAGSVNFEDAFGKLDPTIEGVGETFGEFAGIVDDYFGQVQGTFASNVVAVMQDTGASMKDATEQVTKLSLQAKGAHTNVTALMGVLLQATSSMRLQISDVRDLGQAYGSLAGATKDIFGGKDNAFLAKTTMSAFQGVAQGISGLSLGLKGYLGQKMNLGTGAEAVNRFELGATSGKSDFMLQVMQQLQSMARGTGNAQFALSHGMMNLPPEAAAALANADLTKGMDETLVKYKDIIEATIGIKTSEEDPVQKLLRELQTLLGTIGNALITLLAVQVKQIGGLLSAFSQFFQGNPTNAANIMDATEDMTTKMMNRSKTDLLTQLGNSKSGIAGTVSSLFGPSVTSPEESAYYLQVLEKSGQRRPPPTVAERLTQPGLGSPMQLLTKTLSDAVLDAIGVEKPSWKKSVTTTQDEDLQVHVTVTRGDPATTVEPAHGAGSR